MKKIGISSCLIAAMGAAAVQSSTVADEKFILQPSMRSNIATPLDSSTQDATNEPSAPTSLVTNAEIAQPAPKATETLNSTEIVNTSPSQIIVESVNRTGNGSNQAGQSVPSTSVSGMNWVKRGSLDSKTNSNTISAAQSVQVQSIPKVSSIETSARAYAKPAEPSAESIHSRDEIQSGRQNTIPAQLASNSAAVDNPKARLASRVSKQIIGTENPKRFVAPAAKGIVGPGAVEQRLTEHLIRAEKLCAKGVFLSAREESSAALLELARYLDSLSNAYRSEPTLHAAQVALREAQDFADPKSASIVTELVNAHDTPVLKDTELGRIPPASLSQSYYEYAESMLLAGAEQHPWFSDLFYMFGRTYQAEADASTAMVAANLRAQAVVYYRAAVTIRPSHALAANQLGYILLQLDRPAEAQIALIASVDTKPDKPALQNLAEASRRLGDQAMRQWAMGMIAKQPAPAQPQGIPDVLELDNAAFASTTPVIPISSGTSRTAQQPTMMR